MTNADPNSQINPYQPPSLLDEQTAALSHTVEHESIAFKGSASIQHLKELFSNYDNLGWYPMVTGIVFLVLLQIWATIVGGILALIVTGAVLFVVLMAITSSRWYRMRVFRSSHPLWNQHAEGELTSSGLRIDRVTDKSFYRWHYFAGVVTTDKLVAFIPAVQSEPPVLIGTDMLPPSVAFDELKAFSRGVKAICEGQVEVQSGGWQNQLIMLVPDRERTADVPDSAIRFQGMVRGADVNTIPREHGSAARPIRAHVIRAGIGIALAMVGIGLISVLSGGVSTVQIITATILGLLSLAIWITLVPESAKHVRDDDEIYYLIAHADESGITTDFFVSVTTIPWTNLRIVQQLPDKWVIGQKFSRQQMIARPDMFASPESWDAFCALVKQQTSISDYPS